MLWNVWWRENWENSRNNFPKDYDTKKRKASQRTWRNACCIQKDSLQVKSGNSCWRRIYWLYGFYQNAWELNSFIDCRLNEENEWLSLCFILKFIFIVYTANIRWLLQFGDNRLMIEQKPGGYNRQDIKSLTVFAKDFKYCSWNIQIYIF